MCRRLRTLHLCTALFLCAFLLTYGISALQLAHRQWFHQTQHTTVENFKLAPRMTGARLVARELMERHSMRGELTSVESSTDSLRLRVARLGTVYEVAYSPASGVTIVKTSTRGFLSVLNSIHVSRGFSHASAPMNLWTITLVLVSIGLLTLGASGLYLWFRNHSERLVGSILLTAGAGIATLLIVSMRAGAC